MADWTGEDGELERELRDALRHVAPPEGFAGRVLARAEAAANANAERGRSHARRPSSALWSVGGIAPGVRRWIPAAAAAVLLAAGLGTGAAWLQHSHGARNQGGSTATESAGSKSASQQQPESGTTVATTDVSAEPQQVATGDRPPSPKQRAEATAQLQLAMSLTQHAAAQVGEGVSRSAAGRYTRVLFQDEQQREEP